jgi:hypothetical protein
MRTPKGWRRFEYWMVNVQCLVVGLGLGHVVGVVITR